MKIKEELYSKIALLIFEGAFVGFLLGCLVGVIFMWVATK